jgi:hypothetical protein
MPEMQPTAIIACAVFRDVFHNRGAGPDIPIILMDYGLHLTPRKMRAAIQERLDALCAPHCILIGFGLCGNGLAGLKSRQHMLVIPRVDDCISLFLGSRAAYLREFRDNPATYYLTPGWLECGGEPWSEYQKQCARYGADKASLIADALYGRYRKICFVAFTPEEQERYRPRALQVAEFCRERWNWKYEERIGSDALIRKLLEFACAGSAGVAACGSEEFVIIRPGEEVLQEQFMESRSTFQEESGTCTTYTIK